LQCLQSQGQFFDGKDDIFVAYVATTASGSVAFERQTGIYKFGGPQTQAFKANPPDFEIFPQSGQAAALNEDLLVFATAIDDDAGFVQLVVDILDAAVDLAVVVAKELFDKDLSALADPTKDLIDAIAAAFQDDDVIGTDSILFKTNGTFVGTNGQAKNQFICRGLKANGQLNADYRIKTFEVVR
jgi:hypothetical protein